MDWNGRISKTETIPEYKADNDPYCPHTKSRRFKKAKRLLRKRERLEREDRRRKRLSPKKDRGRGAPLFKRRPRDESERLHGSSSRKRKKKNSLNSLHAWTSGSATTDDFTPTVVSSMRPMSPPTVSSRLPPPRPVPGQAPGAHPPLDNSNWGGGGVTFAPNAVAGDGELELEILKCILLREGYLRRIKDTCKKRNKMEPTAFFGRLVDLLDLVRQSSVETVEAIVKWKHAHDRPRSFQWNGINYLLKMPTDLNHLDTLEPLRKWLGFKLLRNPFIMPVRLDQRPATPKKGGPAARLRAGHPVGSRSEEWGGKPQGDPNPAKKFGSGGSTDPWEQPAGGDTTFYPIGGNYVDMGMSEKRERLLPGGSKGAAAEAAASAGLPYAKEIQSLAAQNAAAASGRRRGKRSKADEIGARARAITMKMMPTQIGDLDMLRIREAEKAILKEEALLGRYIINDKGKVVPEILETRKEAAGLGFGSYLVNLEGDEAREAAMEAMANWGGIKKTEEEKKEKDREDKNEDEKSPSQKKINKKTWRGRRRAQKEGGILAPLTKRGSKGRQQKPMTHTRAARQDAEIRRNAHDIQAMAERLRVMQYEIDKEEKEIRATEGALVGGDTSDPAMQTMATLRGGSGRRRLHRRVQELTARKTELKRQQLELKERKRKLKEAEEIRAKQRAAEKEQQERAHTAKIRRKRLEGEGVAEGEEIVDMTMEEKAAILIQQIARGKVTRLLTQVRRKNFNNGATWIQQSFRAKIARRRVREARKNKKAAIKMQKCVRGLLDRVVMKKLRRDAAIKKSATLMQKTFRFYQGRQRTHLRRKMVEAKRAAVRVTEVLLPFDVNELLGIKPPAPVPVLHLMRAVIMLMALPGPMKESVREISWGNCVNFGKKPFFIDALRSMALDAYEERVLLPKAGVRQVQVYFHDPKFTPNEISKVSPGGYAARLLLVWVQSMLTVHTMLEYFVPWESRRPSLCLTKLHNVDADSLDGGQGGALTEEDKQKARMKKYVGSRRYVPDYAIPKPIARPRPVIVAVARDTPTQRKELVLSQLLTALPGTFVRIDVLPMNVGVVQSAFDVGNSVVMDVHIGQAAANRRAFLEQFSTLRDTLHPRPMCILLHGHRLNRRAGGADSAFGVADELKPRMPDFEIKRLLEKAAEAVYMIEREGRYDLLKKLSGMHRPPDPGTVLLMEALIILFSPQHGFKPPQRTVSMVTWPAAQKLLAFPEQLVRRLRECEIDAIPQRNLRVLRKYLTHTKWPGVDDVFGGDLGPIARLLTWVETSVEYAGKIELEGGRAMRILKGDGLFSSTVCVRDVDSSSQVFTALLWPVLRDLKVYAQARRIQARHTVCSVFLESKTLFFFVYVPEVGMRFHTSLPLTWIEGILAPNSVETLTDPRPPPETTVQLYQRLCELLRFGRFSGRLEIARRMARLKREAVRIGPHLVTLTVSELSFGHLVIQGYSPHNSKLFSLNVGPEECAQLEGDADEYELRDLTSKDARRVMLCILNRLYFRRGRLRIRYNGGSGKKIFEKGVQINRQTVICSVFDNEWGLRLKAYLPESSDTYVFKISRREQLELLGTVAVSQRAKWLRKLIALIQIKGGEILMNRRLYSEARKIGNRYLTIEMHMLGFDGGIQVSAYNNENSDLYVLKLPDKDIVTLVEATMELKSGSAVWPRPTDREGRNAVLANITKLLMWQQFDAKRPERIRPDGEVLMLGEDDENPVASAIKEEREDGDGPGLASVADSITLGKRGRSRRSRRSRRGVHPAILDMQKKKKEKKE
eukprot:g4478.t1